MTTFKFFKTALHLLNSLSSPDIISKMIFYAAGFIHICPDKGVSCISSLDSPLLNPGLDYASPLLNANAKKPCSGILSQY